MSIILNHNGAANERIIVDDITEQANVIEYGESITLNETDEVIASYKAGAIKALDDAGKITITGELERKDITDLETAVDDKAAKTTACAESDAEVSAQADANAQTGAYVQGDVQSIADLANDLKAKYNAAVALINELKGKVDTMNA